MVRGYGRAGHGLFAQPDREKRWRRWREGSINWKPNTSRPFGISFWYTERAECPVFMGECHIRQMTWSLLQWRWSLLMHRGAWRRIQGEQLGGSLRNRPAVYGQLCRELSFLNIHIFNELKRLSPHTDAAHPWRICYSSKGGEGFPAGQMFVQFMILLLCPMEVTWHPPLVWSFFGLLFVNKPTQKLMNHLNGPKKQLISFVMSWTPEQLSPLIFQRWQTKIKAKGL